MNEEVNDIIGRIKQQLKFVRQSLLKLTSKNRDPNDIQISLANIITFGRSVTFVIQNLKSKVDGFDEWYLPYQEEMKNDKLLTFFKDARNNLEKQGRLELSSKHFIPSINSDDIEVAMRNPPENARGFFVADQLGGSGWEILMPDGSIEKLYVNVNVKIFSEIVFLPAGIFHKGVRVSDRSAENAAVLYYNYLENLVTQAEKRFKA